MTGRTETNPPRRGQALMELAIGMFAIAILLSAIVTFALYIVRSLEIENHLRGHSRGVADKIELNDFAAEHVFGVRSLHISEPLGPRDNTIR